MRNDAASGHVIVDHSRVDKVPGYDPGLDDRVDDQVHDPRGDGIHLALGVELLVAGAAHVQLTPVNIALAEDVPKIET